ncbi:MAG: class I SAM-dependent methyltransferase [Dehalococcoidia bacterium]
MGLFETFYDQGLAPLERFGLAGLRRRLLNGLASQVVLEIGIGTGLGLQAYAPGQAVLGLDPRRPFLYRARQKAARWGVALHPVQGDTQALPFPDGIFDLVVAQLVFCTVPDPLHGLREVYRVLRPGGLLVALEHVRYPKGSLAWLQSAATPLWKHLAGGCHLDRDTIALVKEAGFTLSRVERYLGGLLVTVQASRPPIEAGVLCAH